MLIKVRSLDDDGIRNDEEFACNCRDVARSPSNYVVEFSVSFYYFMSPQPFAIYRNKQLAFVDYLISRWSSSIKFLDYNPPPSMLLGTFCGEIQYNDDKYYL